MTFEIAIATPLLVWHARDNPTIPQRAKRGFCRDPLPLAISSTFWGCCIPHRSLQVARTAQEQDPADPLGGLRCLHQLLAINQPTQNDVMPPPVDITKSSFRGKLR